MELKKDDYILGYWFASDKEDNCWYIIMIKRNNEWMGKHTFRYNKEDVNESDPFSGKDEKSIYDITIKGETLEEEIIKNINSLFQFIKHKYNNFSDYFFVRGDIGKFLKIAKGKHYLHFKEKN